MSFLILNMAYLQATSKVALETEKVGEAFLKNRYYIIFNAANFCLVQSLDICWFLLQISSWL